MLRVTVHTDGPVMTWDFMVKEARRSIYSQISDDGLIFLDTTGTLRAFNRDHVVCVTYREMKEPDASKG
jgi:hypothetical protein